jgi:putative nucleotidyltransferase with HDIG domain
MASRQDIFNEFDRHLMEDVAPSEYFNGLVSRGEYPQEYPFTMITDLIDVPQSPEHHPEGSVWNHTMLVVDRAAERKDKSENPHVFMWAALLHDLGKAPTTKMRKGRWTSYDHDKWSKKMAVNFLRDFTDDEEFIKKVSQMARWHMQILFVVKNLPFAETEKMISEVSIDEMALLSMCDRLGRGNMTEEKAEEEKENVRIFKQKCEEVYKNKHRKIEVKLNR